MLNNPDNHSDVHGAEIDTQSSPFWWKHLGAFTGIASIILFLIWAWRWAPAGISPLALFFFAVIIAIASSLVMNIVKQNIPQSREYKIAFYAVFFTIVIVFIVMLVLVMTSTLFGWPQDLRHYLNPTLVRRAPFAGMLALEANWANSLLQDQSTLESGNADRTTANTTKWLEWLKRGGSKHSDTDKLIVLRSQIQDEYFYSFDAKVEFDLAQESSGNLLARFAEGAAFLRHVDAETGQVSYRQLMLTISPTNMDREPGSAALENTIKNIEINAGDQLWILVRLLGEDALPTQLTSYTANLVSLQ